MFGILTDRYKSQPEVGRGGAAAAHDPEGRRRASKKFFGHSGVENNEYEKCGYLGLPDSDDDWSNDARAYGGSNPVMYTFKKDRMNDRVTYTYGDSLNTRYFSYSAVEELYYICTHRNLQGVTQDFLDCYMEKVVQSPTVVNKYYIDTYNDNSKTYHVEK